MTPLGTLWWFFTRTLRVLTAPVGLVLLLGPSIALHLEFGDDFAGWQRFIVLVASVSIASGYTRWVFHASEAAEARRQALREVERHGLNEPKTF